MQLKKLATDEVLNQINWDGRNKKTAAKNMILFQKILFDACDDKQETYEISMRNAMVAAHQRVHVRNHRNKPTADENVN